MIIKFNVHYLFVFWLLPHVLMAAIIEKPKKQQPQNLKDTAAQRSSLEHSSSGTSAQKPATQLPKIKDETEEYLFVTNEGYVLNTPENKQLFLNLVSDRKNWIEGDAWGDYWYVKVMRDGKQIWATVRDNVIQNGGINNSPKGWNPVRGLRGIRETFIPDELKPQRFEALFHAQEQKGRDKTPGKSEDKILEGGITEREIRGTTKKFEKPGGEKEAFEDFISTNPSNIRNLSDGRGLVGDLPDNRIINVRKEGKSTDGRPTVEIYDPINKTKIKIRYGFK